MKRSFSRAWILVFLGCCLCCVQARAQDAVGEVYASDASVHGAVVLAGGGTRVLSGSTVAAGLSPATLKLTRGGEVRVCPGTNVSLATSQARALSMGFSSGAVELHYALAASADTVQTSDFRLLLAGPGTFHVAVSADQLGNTCVRPLAQNTSSVIVQELFGDAAYQVKADEAIVFRKGRVADPSHDVPPDCGCPVLPDVKRAEAEPSPRRRGDAEEKGQRASTEMAVASAPAAPTPPTLTSKPAGDAPVEVESPFVFHADPSVPDPPQLTTVRLTDRGKVLAFQPVVLPPEGTKVETSGSSGQESAKLQPPKTFLGKVRSFFATIFK